MPLNDQEIIDLYFSRSESAISETKLKYSRLLRSIALGILRNMEDAEECEDDTYMRTWNAIPPTKPNVFSAFLSKITRSISLDKYDNLHAAKRGSGEIPLLLDELSECLPDSASFEDQMATEDLYKKLNAFLAAQKKDARVIFMRRYWYGDSIAEIADKYNWSASKVKMSLKRSRKDLQTALMKEGYDI